MFKNPIIPKISKTDFVQNQYTMAFKNCTCSLLEDIFQIKIQFRLIFKNIYNSQKFMKNFQNGIANNFFVNFIFQSLQTIVIRFLQNINLNDI